MRRLFALAILGSGCFSETAGDACPSGEPGCRCDQGSCNAGSECVVSIDRCVPEDCSPGTHTCTCTSANTCDGALVCEGGVCLEDAMTSATADSQASTGATTQGSSTDPQTSTSTTGATDADSSTTDVPSTGSTSVDTSTTTSATSMACVMCLENAWTSPAPCQDETNVCLNDNGCSATYQCFHGVGIDCCSTDRASKAAWAAFVECAAPACDAADCDVASLGCE